MQTKLRWEKKLFSNLYSIYSNGQQIGELKNKTFTQTSDGELNGEKYAFKTRGFFNQHTEIINLKEDKVIGEISYNNWMTKAEISINGKVIHWKYDNVWNTKWSISNAEDININYAGSSSSGQIDSNTDDPLTLLSGLYVTNYYWQMTIAVLVAVFVPIFASGSN